MRPLTVLDSAFVHLETPATPMHVGALFVLHPPAGGVRPFVAKLRRHLRARLGASPVFTRRLASPPLQVVNPVWVEAGDVDMVWHVRVHRVPAPGRRREVEDFVATLHEVPLDRARPLWELHVLEGLTRGRVALYLKVHHAGFDGASAQRFLRCIADGEAQPRRDAPLPPPAAQDAGALDVLGTALAHQWSELQKLPERLRTLASAYAASPAAPAVPTASRRRSGGRGAPRTPLNGPITAGRTFASADVPLAGVRAFARARDVTINDVLLAAVGGALRRWLRDRDALPDATLLAAVPVSLRTPGDETHAVRVSFATYALHTDRASPAARLAAISADTRRAKLGAAAGALPVPDDLPSLGIPWLLGGLARLFGRPEVTSRIPLPWNVLVSNVAGPPQPLYVLGTRVLTYTPVSIPFHGLALNVTVYSYDGRLYFGLTGARCSVPDAVALTRLVTDELRTLRRTGTSRSPRLRPAARARTRPAA